MYIHLKRIEGENKAFKHRTPVKNNDVEYYVYSNINSKKKISFINTYIANYMHLSEYFK